MTFVEKLKEYGVVGAGGAGFPTYIKANSKVEYLLANGAECEPLIHKDVEIMKHFPKEIISGFELMMIATGAQKGKIGIKEKNWEAIESIEKYLHAPNQDVFTLGDFYPSGDEYELVYLATNRLIPAGGIPLNVGTVVNNVETLFNIHQANSDKSLIYKMISVNGAVKHPKTFFIPIGTSYKECIELAGGTKVDNYVIFVSGLMMGTLCKNLDDVITKTTAGLIVLPKDHYLVTRRDRNISDMNRIGKSACDQCSYCTEFCPRYLLGYEVMPHKVMRSLGFTLTGKEKWNQWADLCCSCGLCTLYACPEDLYPKEACDNAKWDMKKEGIKFKQEKEVRVHPMKESRRVPQSLLRKRLNVDMYDFKTPFEEIDYAPQSVKIKLQQHIGKIAEPIVKLHQFVDRGEKIAEVGENDLGVNIHSSIKGKISIINKDFIEIISSKG